MTKVGTKRKSEYKPLLFTTTVRNPKRMKGLLHILAKYDKQILTSKNAETIISDLIRYGIYRPMKVPVSVKQKWSSTKKGEFSEIILSDDEVNFILENNPQNHKEAGFDKGWPSRFATFFDFAKELGFVYYYSNENIEFSEIGLKLANSISIKVQDDYILYSNSHPEFEQQAFLHAMAKYQRNNPFVRVLNDNVPLILLLEVINLLNEDKDFNSVGISKLELPLVLYWKDNNSQNLYRRIKKLRKDYKYTPSWEIISDICQNEIMEGKDIVRDLKSIMVDYPDEFIRKMRLTGLISLRGGGRFIDINNNEIKKVNYIFSTYSDYPKFISEKEYFNYMATTDKYLITISSKPIDIEESDKLLSKWIEYYSWDTIKEEILALSKKRKLKDNVLKYLSHPIRLEFLAALAIKSRFKEIKIIPNYPCDDEGIPTSTACGQGNQGDIECFEDNNGVLVEVTMSGGRTQTMMEVWPITRHLEEFSKKVTGNSMCHFIAPDIFIDSRRQIEFVREKNGLFISARSINDFVEYIEKNEKLYELN